MATKEWTDQEAKTIASTTLQQVGRWRLSALHPANLVYGEVEHGDVMVAFLLGNGATKRLRKIVITYNLGPDTYTVESFVTGTLMFGPSGTTVDLEKKYSADGVYCDNLGEVVIAAARAAGARPRCD